MKAMRLIWGIGGILFIIGSLLVSAVGSFAQTSTGTGVPVVAITTPTNGAIFPALTNIQLIAEGSDSNGYVTSMEFFAGTNSLGIVTNAVIVDPPVPPNGFVAGTRAFFLTWSNVPAGPYILTAKGTANNGLSAVSAPVYIRVGPTSNLPPTVAIVEPTNGAVFPAQTNIQITAETGEWSIPPGLVTSVEFLAGTNILGVVTDYVSPLVLTPGGPITQYFTLIWSNVPPGKYALTAEAKDTHGLSAISALVNITVGSVSNLPPIVRITSPPNNAVFRAPVTLPLFAYAHSPGGDIVSVDYYDGTNLLGSGNPIMPTPVTPLADGTPAYSTPVSPGPIPSPLPPIIIFPTNLYVFIWSNVPIGMHVLTAVATDNNGLSTTSDPVNITILPGLPPPTNLDIVNIVATEPIAIEGTNCWPWLGLAGGPLTWSNWVSPTPICRVFTNYGPKDAVFTVGRLGSTNSDLTVNYSIGGTASNGVDYVMLPGFVTISAGECSARITVVPLDDGPPDIPKTVILTLTPSTNLPPDYLVGFPPKAAAIILEGPVWPVSAVMSDKCFHLGTTGPDGGWFHIECSPDLINWTPICTNQVVNGKIDFVDPDAISNSCRYYRAVPEPGVSAQ